VFCFFGFGFVTALDDDFNAWGYVVVNAERGARLSEGDVFLFSCLQTLLGGKQRITAPRRTAGRTG